MHVNKTIVTAVWLKTDFWMRFADVGLIDSASAGAAREAEQEVEDDRASTHTSLAPMHIGCLAEGISGIITRPRPKYVP